MLAPKWLLLLVVLVQNSHRFNSESNSILDIINTQQVERMISERQRSEQGTEKQDLIDNDLSTDEYNVAYEHERIKLLNGAIDGQVASLPTKNPRIEVDVLYRRHNLSAPYKTIDLIADLRGLRGRKILKSSKNALIVTRMEYLKRDWCKTEPLIQKVRETGCLTRTIVNKFCYGQCNSFYIPKVPKKGGGGRGKRKHSPDIDSDGFAFKSCAFCKPKRHTWTTVTLKCPNRIPIFRKRRILHVKKCKCVGTNLN